MIYIEKEKRDILSLKKKERGIMVIDYKKLKSQISRDSLGCNLFSATWEQKLDDVDSIARVCSKREFMRTMEYYIRSDKDFRKHFTK